MPVNIQLSKNKKSGSWISDVGCWLSSCHNQHPTSDIQHRFKLVGLGRIELPTSPLSGVRSSQLSYRPEWAASWWSWSGSNRRPPECKSGALPTELQPLVSLELSAISLRNQLRRFL